MTAFEQFEEKIIDGATSVWVPAVILGLFILAIIFFQVLAMYKSLNGFLLIIPMFFGIAGGFSSLATMSYYSTFSDAITNSLDGQSSFADILTAEQLAMAPNFDAYTLAFMILAIFYFISSFVSFVLALVQLIRMRNTY